MPTHVGIFDDIYSLKSVDFRRDCMLNPPSCYAVKLIIINKTGIVLNLLMAKPDYPLYIDWQETTIIASSFADEFLGKLFVELGKPDLNLSFITPI